MFYNRKQSIRQIISKDYYATLLIQNWLDTKDEESEYDDLIIKFLETLPETVSVKTTLEHALVICLEFRRNHVHNIAKASRACSFALSIRRILKFWEPDPLVIPGIEVKRTCLIDRVMEYQTVNVSADRFLVIQLPPGIKKVEVDHSLIFGFDHSQKYPKLWTQHLPDLYNEPVGLITINGGNSFAMSTCNNPGNEQQNTLDILLLQALKDCNLKPATYAILKALVISHFVKLASDLHGFGLIDAIHR